MAVSEKDIKPYLIFDQPVPYKKLMIRCAKIKEYLDFYAFANVLSTEKDDPSMLAKPEDEKAVSEMDFLTFLFYLGTNHKLERNTERSHLFLFDKLLKLVCDLPATKVKTDNKNASQTESYIEFLINPETEKAFIRIDGEDYNGEDVDNILDIISIQNGVDRVDYKMTKELRDALDSALKFKAKVSGATKMADFENQLTALSVVTGWPLRDIYEMSIRKFNQAIARVDKFETWKIFTLASMTGLVKFPSNSKGLEHWLCDLDDKDKYASVTTSVDHLKNKVAGQEAMEAAKARIDKINHR